MKRGKHIDGVREESLFAPEERVDAPGAGDTSAANPADGPVRIGGLGGTPAPGADEAPYGGPPLRAPLDPRARKVITLGIVFAVVFVLGLFLPANAAVIGTTGGIGFNIPSPAAFSAALQERAGRVFSALSLSGDMMSYLVISSMVIVALTGAGLGLSGAVYQGAFRNALASPSTFGVMSGATLGVTLFYVWGGPPEENPFGFGWSLIFDFYDPVEHLWYQWMPCVFGFVGAMATVAIVLAVAGTGNPNRDSKVYTVVVGQVLVAICTGLYNSIKAYYQRVDPWGARTAFIAKAQSATFGNTMDWVALVIILVPLVALLVFALRNSRKLTLLSLGDKEAASLGVASTRLRMTAIVACTVLTAIIVAFCGPIGFVGFFVPHLMRKVVGPSFKYLLPATILASATFTTGVYAVMSFFSRDDMAGMAISLIGAAAFFVIALQQRGKAHGDWD